MNKCYDEGSFCLAKMIIYTDATKVPYHGNNNVTKHLYECWFEVLEWERCDQHTK